MRPARLRPALSALAIALFLAQSGPGLAHPLLLEDTSTVYQRVLTRPGAALHDAPGGPVASRYPAFQPLYVFARQEGWVEVGPSASAAPAGWVETGTVVEWKQNIVATFTNPADRARSLMFRTEDGLRGFMEDEALVATQARLIEKAETGMLAPEDGVVAIEPENYVNIRERFYILPILDFVEDLHPMTYDANLLLKVASVPLRDDLPAAEASSAAGDFDAGVVFVFDTTKSMQPYIERTRKALARIIFDINGTDIGERINFGIEAFRDNPEAVPGLAYRTREVIPLDRRLNQLPVLEAIDNTRTATVSSPGFNEDSLAGVEDAIRRTDWDQAGTGDPFDARYVILMTDAGPKDPRDPNARSEIGPVEIQRDAEGRNIVIMTLHLKTAAGAANHDYAAERYRQLSRFAGRQFYYPIEGGSEQAFEDTVTALVTALTDHVRMALGQAQVQAPEDRDANLEFLGHALQLAWLGAREGTRAPDVFESWVTERAAEKPQALALEPRLLVTKNEMATMAELLDNLVRLAEGTRGEDEARGFFRQVRGVIAQMAQNPDRLVATDADSLGGALEYLERLPYRSQLLQTDEARWMSGPMVRREIIDGMRQKLTQYRKWLYDPSVWTALYEGAPDGEQVFAMPFDILP
ncbi:VWA domain-containing protein [Rhodovulum sp. YEN HP10]|uniref:VWA domain-containing protein n=1 Tax=Rhodovulum sp. HP10 TaxID=3387397 RepID=UPI0039E03A24